MSALPWLKLWTETLHDRKITKAPPVTRWAWIACLMLAAQGGNGGRLDLTPGKPMDEDDIQHEAGISAAEWRAARDYFLEMGMLRRDADGAFVVCNFTKRQESKDPTGAQRQARMRERNALRNGDNNALRNALPVTGVTPLLSRVESESESESESDQHPALKATRAPSNGKDGVPGGGDDFSLVEAAHGRYVGKRIFLEQAKAYEDWLRITTPQAIIEALRFASEQGARSPYAYAMKILQGQRDDRTLPLPAHPLPMVVIDDMPTEGPSWL